MTEEEGRRAIVNEARSWLGTPYIGNGDVKGAGVDCGMLLVRVFVDTGLVPAFDPRPYPIQWSLHQKAERYLEIVRSYAKEITGPPKPGDIAMFLFGHTYSHGTIVIDWPTVIHSNPPGKCREVDTSVSSDFARLIRRAPPKFFSIWE